MKPLASRINTRVGRLLTCAFAVATIAALGTARPANAIVGGTPADPDAFPYFADIVIQYGGFGGAEFCGGSVIAPGWVLSAAHCFDEPGAVEVHVLGHGGWYHASTMKHPLWNGNSGDGHDLELLQVDQAATAGVTPIQVGAPWEPEAYWSGAPATIMGTGATSPGGTAGSVFLVADTELRSDDYMDDTFPWRPTLMIGAGAAKQTICFGDSGGPLVVGRNNQHPVQVGVANFGTGSCSAAAAFAELSGPQLAWVASHVPSIMDAWSSWGVCIGHNEAEYTPYSLPGYGRDGSYSWRIGCSAAPTIVPDLRGYTGEDAESALEAVGLRLEKVDSALDSTCRYVENTVMRQDPSAHSGVMPGSSVSITLSRWPDICP